MLRHLTLVFLLSFTMARAQDKKNDFRERIDNEKHWNVLCGKPLSAKYGNVSSIKIVYDIADKKIYYINSRRYKFHFDFCSKHLNTYSSLEEFNLVEYSSDKERKYLLANLNFYRQQNKYTLEFFADDHISSSNVIKLFGVVKNSVYFGKSLFLLLNAEKLISDKNKICGKVPCIDADSLYQGQRYQCLVTGTAVGRLRFVDFKELSKSDLRATDIVITNGLPLLVPPVAAIVTSEFQTPLSHVNMLAQARHLPDAALRGIYTSTHWKKWENTLVKIEVNNDSVWVVPATAAELQVKKKKEVKLSPDWNENRLTDVKTLRIRDIDKYGGKASNMGELYRVKIKGGLNLPEAAFAVPLHYYFMHAKACGVGPMIDSVLNDTSIRYNRIKLAALLSRIRRDIRNYPVEKALIDSVTRRLKHFPQYAYFRFRSSTNAEDIEGFNGAGLYDSYSGSLTDTAKTIENAMRKTWASLWNQRAFEERELYGIDHRQCGMGVLVHRAFGTEAANGVAITANIYRLGYPSFIINSQPMEHSVVSPLPGERCEQIILNHKITDFDVNEISIDLISTSSFTQGELVFTQAQLFELCRYLFAIKEHFYYRTRYGRKAKGFLPFAMDVEFKLDAQTKKIYIKQARPLEVRSEE